MIKKYALAFLAIALVSLCRASALPVMPYPQYAGHSDDTVAYPVRIEFSFEGVNEAQASALQDVWRKFAAEPRSGENLPPAKLVLAILGQNASTDALIRASAPNLEQLGSEGYVLIINKEQRILAANTDTGLYYGLQTLKQLTRANYTKGITIIDWPDFPLRAIFDDISRGPIPTVDYIKKQIDRMSELKINYLSFYIEHVVQPVSRPDFAPPDGKLTIPQIKELSAYAAEHHMQLIGSFQSFGHFDKILALPQYKSMGETNTLISPLDPEARKFLADVIGELCEAFNAPYFNVNCDETFDLTKGRSKEYIDKVGPAKFYADHLNSLYNVVKSHGKRMMMWGDVAMQHEEIIDLLPKDIIYLPWEYGPKDNFDPWIQPFVRRDREFMVCPGILNSYRMFPDMVMAKANITGFLKQGKQNGATGAHTTIWDDGGSYLFDADWYGVYVAAEKSWNGNDIRDASFNQRYETTAYGSSDQYYTQALFKLLELRGVDLTYNLNDQLWHQKILPAPGKHLILNNASVAEADQILAEARDYLSKISPSRNQGDIEALRFAIDQYKIMMDTRFAIGEISKVYAKVLASPQSAKAVISTSIDVLDGLIKRYETLRERFRLAWLGENQNYWLDKVLAPYDEKKNDLLDLRTRLDQLLATSTPTTAPNLPKAADLRLDILVSDRFYFKNWMLGGPFPLEPDGILPPFLYSEKKEYDKPPSPGDFTHWQGKTYRWQKYSSTEGGIIDLDANYKDPKNAAAYASCLINSPIKEEVKAWISTNSETEVYSNGVKIYAHARQSAGFPHEQEITLPLKPGTNHVLIKQGKNNTQPWIFTFRLQDDLPITNHKHKYTLNPKVKEFDAE